MIKDTRIFRKVFRRVIKKYISWKKCTIERIILYYFFPAPSFSFLEQGRRKTERLIILNRTQAELNYIQTEEIEIIIRDCATINYNALNSENCIFKASLRSRATSFANALVEVEKEKKGEKERKTVNSSARYEIRVSNYDPAFPHRTSVEKPRCHDDETLSHQGEELTPFRHEFQWKLHQRIRDEFVKRATRRKEDRNNQGITLGKERKGNISSGNFGSTRRTCVQGGRERR